MKREILILVCVVFFILIAGLACNAPVPGVPTDAPPPVGGDEPSPTQRPPSGEPGANSSPPGALVQPADLSYQGAFRLPAGGPDEIGWKWSGEALAYYPDGDLGRPDDGFPGSLFGTGHNWNQYVSEISIPVPVDSSTQNLEELNVATPLQPFQDVRGGLIEWPLEQARAGLAYLPAQGQQTGGKLYFCWAPHLDEGATNPSHGWCETDLSSPQPAGPWRVGEYENYVTTDYMFPIPPTWAEANTPGMRLATGRYRDGGQGSLGPSLFAIGPADEGNPPPAGATVPAVPLLLYGSIYEEGAPAMDGYAHSDHWSGGAWLTAGDRTAVVFVGTKGLGETWYGCADGTVWPEEPPYPPECPERGWWSERFAAQIIFYDPAQLAAVATGVMEPGAPQPYALLEIEDVLYSADFILLNHLGAAAFDRQRGLLYVLEPLVDDDRSIVHTWQVE